MHSLSKRAKTSLILGILSATDVQKHEVNTLRAPKHTNDDPPSLIQCGWLVLAGA